MEKRLYRSREKRVLSGVCGGIGAYFDIDPVIIRLLWAIFSLFGFLIIGIVIYIIAAIIIPEEPEFGVIDAEYEVKE